MSDPIELPEAEGGYSVVPGQIRALSQEGRAWFEATAKRANAAKPRRVPQNLASAKRAIAEAKKDDYQPFVRPNRYMAHVVARWEFEAEQEAISAADAQGVTGWSARKSLIASRMSFHYDRVRAMGCARWFAYDDQGKVVLSLVVSRERALDIALGYNEAGGRLVLLAPEPVLDDAALEDCVAIPDVRPPPPPAPEKDPLRDFAGDTGLIVCTPHGTVALARFDDETIDRTHALVDPARCGPAAVVFDGIAPANDDESIADSIKQAYARIDVPTPEGVAEWTEAAITCARWVVYEGKPSALPPLVPVAFKGRPLRKMLRFDVKPEGGEPFVAVADPKQVKALAKGGGKRVRVEVLADFNHGVAVVRADGCIGITSGWDLAGAQFP
jgi:hypothetical protein